MNAIMKGCLGPSFTFVNAAEARAPPKSVFVMGDMAQPLFGLSEEAFDYLAELVDSIWHSGALVDWMRPLEDYIGPNIFSAHEVLQLASYGRGKAVHLISTMSTISKYMGYEIKEEAQEYGSATSKNMAERMVAPAHGRGAKASCTILSLGVWNWASSRRYTPTCRPYYPSTTYARPSFP